jgi:hypothetical protein
VDEPEDNHEENKENPETIGTTPISPAGVDVTP